MKLRVALYSYTVLIITTRIRNMCSLETLALKVWHHSSTISGLSSQCSRNCWSGRINTCLLFGLHADPSSMSARIIMSCTVPCHMSWLQCARCLLHAADAWDITTTTQTNHPDNSYNLVWNYTVGMPLSLGVQYNLRLFIPQGVRSTYSFLLGN